MLQAGGGPKMWMGFFTVINFVISPGQMRVIAVVIVEDAEVSIHTFGVIDEGMLRPRVFLTCNEHLAEMLAAFLAYKAVMQDSCRGV